MTTAEHLGRLLAAAADIAEMRPKRTYDDNVIEIREAAMKLGFDDAAVERAIQIMSDDSL